MTTELQTRTADLPAVSESENQAAGIFASLEAFEGAQRMAKVLMASSLVPKNYRESLADCVIALDVSSRMRISPIAVMQSLFVVHGKPAWEAKALVAFLNQTGRFSPVRYDWFGDRETDGRGCRASVTDRNGREIVGPECTIRLAKAEGWFSRNGSKWQTMPDLMLAYRAATWLCRLVAPELGLGLPTKDEVIDITPERVSPLERPAVSLLSRPEPVIQTAEVVTTVPDADFSAPEAAQ